MKETGGSLSLETRQRLATLAYTRTASYDLAISSHILRKQLSDEDFEFSRTVQSAGKILIVYRNGILKKNPKRCGSLTRIRYQSSLQKSPICVTAKIRISKPRFTKSDEAGGIAKAEQLHGKEMSFNNYVDAEAAWNLVCDFDELACAIIKHTNPSGVGTGATNEEAYRRALATDPVSAFGGIVAFNRTVDANGRRIGQRNFYRSRRRAGF